MSVRMIGESGAIAQWLRQDQTAGAGEAFSLDAELPSLDRISVDLPNGYKVSATHVGNSGFNAQLLASLEDIVDHLSRIAPSGNHGTTPPPGIAPGQRNADGSPMEYRTLDSFHVDLPNGYSVDISRASLPGGGDNDHAAMAAMAEAIENLVARFGAYPGVASDLRPDPAADLLPAAKNA